MVPEKGRGRGRELKVAYTNIDGIISTALELKDFLRKEQPDIMGIVETKLTGGIDALGIGDGNYNIWIKNRENKKGGGVMLMVKKELTVENVTYGENDAEVLSARVQKDLNKWCRIIICYVPPKTNAWEEVEYNGKLENTKVCLHNILQGNREAILMGDFNCKEVCWESWTTNSSEESWGNTVLEMAMENILTQWVNENTRFRNEENPSRLDLIFTKGIQAVTDLGYKTPLGKSDHVVIEFKLSWGEGTRRNENHRREWLNYSKANYNQLRQYFTNTNWKKVYETKDIEKKWSTFLNIYNEGIQKWVPKRTTKEQAKNDWFNGRCFAARKEREEAWNKWRRNRRPDLWTEYKKKRNEYVKIRKREQRNYEKNIVENCKAQPKLFYRFINGKLKTKDDIVRIKNEGEVIENPEAVAEAFNKQFQSVFTKEQNFNEEAVTENREGLNNIVISTKEIKDILEKLDVRKAMGPDGVANWVLKECSSQLMEVIQNIVNSTLQKGKIPKDWKRADITPIYKSGNKEEPLNYRPVSLTSVVAKISERIIKDQWVKYLEDNNILTEKQFGFRKGRSCATNLISFYSRVIDVVQERDGWVDCIYLDLKKAFDKVPHERLLWKLKNIGGLKGNILAWMSDFLIGREMRTVVRGCKSCWRLVTSGVPQGSVLAPVMFAIYINDMTEGISSYMNLFADDAKLMRKITKREDCDALNQDLNKIKDWSSKWNMEFNIKKCSVMEFGKSGKRLKGNYSLGNETITKKTEEKDLGVTISSSLSFGKHIRKITGETYNILRNIKLAFNYIDEEMMKKLIVSIIRPRLEYAAVLWSPHLKKDVRTLERIQRVATKIPYSLENISYEERLERLGLTTLEKRRERGDLIALYRTLGGLEKMDRDDLVVRDERNTRGHGRKIKVNACRRDIKKYSFPHRCIQTWNGLDQETVCAKTIQSFKASLDKSRYGDGTARA